MSDNEWPHCSVGGIFGTWQLDPDRDTDLAEATEWVKVQAEKRAYR